MKFLSWVAVLCYVTNAKTNSSLGIQKISIDGHQMTVIANDYVPIVPYTTSAITLGIVSEAHNLCLIALILESDVARGAAAGINAADVPKLNFNHTKVRDEAAGLRRQKTSLASRIVPVGAREEAWRARTVEGPSDNLLQAKVLTEVIGLLRNSWT